MLEYRIAVRFERTMAEVFAALVCELAEGRWSDSEESAGSVAVPRAGLRFGYRQARRLYSGEVLECLRPVSIVIVERYCGPAVSILARQRWHVDPLDSATRLRGDVRVETNRFARLQMRFWKSHFTARAQRTCSRVRIRLCANGRSAGDLRGGAPGDAPGDARGDAPSDTPAQRSTIGQKTGSVSIVSAKTTSVSGKPIFR